MYGEETWGCSALAGGEGEPPPTRFCGRGGIGRGGAHQFALALLNHGAMPANTSMFGFQVVFSVWAACEDVHVHDRIVPWQQDIIW